VDVTSHDVVILGGGPAGSVTAALLARAGVDVAVLEKQRFPRYHLGESLAPMSLPVLDALGLRDAFDERYVRKYGVRFVDCRTGRQQRYDYTDAAAGDGLYAWQAPRADFDARLLARAMGLGAAVHEGTAAEDVLFEAGRATGVRARADDGTALGYTARIVVDATGQDSLLATRLGHRAPVAGLDRTALVAHYQHVTRNVDDTEGDLDAVLFPHGWVWNIPFLGEVNSVGAVCSATWMRARARGESLEAFFARTLDDAPVARAMLSPATRLTPVRSVSDFAHRAATRSGAGWLLVGDAAGFFDPLFCAGTHLAIAGASEAAAALLQALARPDDEAAHFARHDARMGRAMDLYQGLTQALHAGDLTEAIFQARTRSARQPLAAVLAGDVFGDDPPWRAALRARFAPRGA
jgi:flavin-dependent dehydrogenase